MEGILASVNVDKTGELSRRSSRASLSLTPSRSLQPSLAALSSFQSRLATLVSRNEYENDGQLSYDYEGSPLALAAGDSQRRITINVSGRKFEASLAMLSRYPTTLLGNTLTRQPYYDAQRDEYFFERNRECFECILNFYHCGLLRRPQDIPIGKAAVFRI